MKRRQLLKSSLALPFLSRKAFATESSSPKRLLVFFNYHGIVYDSWRMRPDLPSNTEWQISLPATAEEFSQELSPLFPFRNRATVLDGLAMVSADADNNSAGLRHEAGAVHALTGNISNMISYIPLATTPSLDQAVSNHISRSDHFQSLEWGVGQPTNSPIYRSKHVQLSSETNPIEAYLRLFGHSERPATQPSAQSLLLNALQNRYANTIEKLPSSKQSTLKTHLDLLGDLDARIAGLNTIRETCPGIDIPNTSQDYEQDFEAFCQLIATTFSCDFSRVLSLNMGSIPMEILSGRAGDVHGEYAHLIYENAEAKEKISLHYQLNASHFAQLASVLDGITDPLGDGIQSLLDNTMMLWVSEVADGTHSFERWPVVVLGGDRFSPFPKGKYQYYPSNTPYNGWSYLDGYHQSMGVPHQKLLTTIAQSFGINTNCFGQKKILGNDNLWIDCSGVLYR